MLNRLIFLYLITNKTINIINTTRFKIAKEILWKPKKTILQVVIVTKPPINEAENVVIANRIKDKILFFSI